MGILTLLLNMIKYIVAKGYVLNPIVKSEPLGSADS